MTDLAKQNFVNLAEEVRSKLESWVHIKVIHGKPVDLSDDRTFLQYLAIDLDGLRAAVEQRIQELGSHEPQDFG